MNTEKFANEILDQLHPGDWSANKAHTIAVLERFKKQCQSTASQPNKLITFKDHGQDFLQWLVAPDGKVLDCEPAQSGIWCKYLVYNFDKLKVGGRVEIGKNNHEMTINYVLEAIEETALDSIRGYKKITA